MDENQSNNIEKDQRDILSAHIENEIKKHSQVNTWDDFQPDKVSEAILQNAIQKSDSFPKDKQSRYFAEFLSIATCFSSLPYALKLNKVPELVNGIKLLLQNMMAEVREYSDMASEIKSLFKCFTEMVKTVLHNVNLMLPLLKTANNQINILDDAINPQQNREKLNEVDKKDIQLALNRMSSGIDRFVIILDSAKDKSLEREDKVLSWTNSVKKKKKTVEDRLDIVDLCLKSSITVSGIAFGGTVSGLVASAGYGGVGALTIAGVAFPPVTAIVCATLLGGGCVMAVVYLVRRFWVRRQMKALGFLNGILESLNQLNAVNSSFLGYIIDAKENANVVKEHMQDVQKCLENERNRKLHQNACAQAAKSTEAMINSLQKISSLDLSQLTSKICLALNSEN